MKLLLLISNLIIPVTIFSIILFGYSKKVEVYDTFIEGAKEGILTVFDILPTLIGLMTAVSVLRGSGILDLIMNFFRPLVEHTGFPAEIIPLSMMRLVSSSASTGILLDLFKTFGPDSFIGRLASTMMGCTETVFYTMSVYFMSINIKNTGYTLAGALLSNVAGIIASFYVTIWLFGI